jgi:chitinase
MYLNGGAVVFLLSLVLQTFFTCFYLNLQRIFFSIKWPAAHGAPAKCGISRLYFNIIGCSTGGRKSCHQPPTSNLTHLWVRLALLMILLSAVPFSAAYAASVDLEWDPNTEPVLAGYKIYWGTSSGNYPSSKDVGNTTTCTITGLVGGQTYYFAATAYDVKGAESDYSNQISYAVPFGDSDGDGVPDDQDAFPSNPAETTDTDGDGIGNNADPDDDNDRMPDAWELQYGFDPLKDDASEDSDGDGLSNLDEYYAGSNPVVPQGNFEPDAPALTTPVNHQVVELTPVLKTNQFFDPNSGDFHSATQWQIHRASDNVCIFDIISEYSLTELELPKLILSENSDYTWQARYYDNHGAPSQWSGSGSFSTRSDPDDTNHNGIPDSQEVGTPTDLDGNGQWDSDQDSIKCVQTADGKALGISFKQSGSVVEIESVSAESENGNEVHAGAAGSPDYFPFGLINFKLILNQPGDQIEITVHFSEPIPAGGRWLKYDPIEATWTDYTALTEFTSDRRSITLSLEDGGDGDADGIVNGIIVDPSGAAVSSSSLGGSSGGSGGDPVASGCFISTASSPAHGTPLKNLWREIRGRELAVVLVLIGLLKVFTSMIKRAKLRWEEIQRRYEAFHERGTRFTASDIIKVPGARYTAHVSRRTAHKGVSRRASDQYIAHR